MNSNRRTGISMTTLVTFASFAITLVAVIAPLRAIGNQDPRPASDAQPQTFEVASIKRNSSDDGSRSIGLQPGGRFVMTNSAVGMLIRSAYPDAVEYIGGPDWMRTEPYDVTALGRDGMSRADMPPMLRALLADRFNFAAHYEMREQATYDLVLARTTGPAPALKKIDIDCEGVRAARDRGDRSTAVTRLASGMVPCSDGMSYGDRIIFSGGGTSMARLAEMLRGPSERVVFDRTGLAGYYEFQLTFQLKPDPNDDTPALFPALQEQLGLRLESSRRAVPVLVIDRIDRPSEN
jgi:uncharacterized protein (TIGR03435 family)